MKRILSYLVVGIVVIAGLVNHFTTPDSPEGAVSAAPATAPANDGVAQGLSITPTAYFSRTETPLITDEQLADEDLHYIVHMLPSDPSVRNYAMLYDASLRMAYWVAYPLCDYYMKGSGKTHGRLGLRPRYRHAATGQLGARHRRIRPRPSVAQRRPPHDQGGQRHHFLLHQHYAADWKGA